MTAPWQLHCGDGVAGLRDHDPVDVTITDPPYTEHVNDHARASPKRVRGRQQVVEREFGFAALSPEIMDAAAAAIAYRTWRWAIVFCAHDQQEDWREALTRHGMVDVKRTLIWWKSNSTPQLTGDRPAFNYECAVLMHGAGVDLRWNGGGLGSVLQGPIDETHKQSKRGGTMDRHPTAKPLWLMRRLVELFTDPGELVADPFAGGATTLVASVVEGRRAVGWEIDRKSYNIGMRRLSDPGTVPLEGPSLELQFTNSAQGGSDREDGATEGPAAAAPQSLRAAHDACAEVGVMSDDTAHPGVSDAPPDSLPPAADSACEDMAARAAEIEAWPGLDDKIGPDCFAGTDFPDDVEDEWDRF